MSLVSVWMITYNHGRYIAEAIESIMMQKTTFPVELVIGEDGSTDDTRAIILAFCARYPGRIRLLEQRENLGMMQNTLRTLRACNGKYVAMCEGDDYWTDEYKLQKQYDFMEQHPDCALCFHAAHYKHLDNRQDFIHRNAEGDAWMKLGDVVRGWGGFVPTASMFFRGAFIEELPPWFERAFLADYPLCVFLALKGRVRYLGETMSVYRKESVDSWTSGTWNNRRMRWFTRGMCWILTRYIVDTRGGYLGLMGGEIIRRNWSVFKGFAYPVVAPFKKRRLHVRNTIS